MFRECWSNSGRIADGGWMTVSHPQLFEVLFLIIYRLLYPWKGNGFGCQLLRRMLTWTKLGAIGNASLCLSSK